MQWLLLCSICLLIICYMNNKFFLVPIQDQLMNYYEISDIDYNLLQSLYTWPNAIISILLGLAIDKFGLNKMIYVSWITVMIGNVISIISASHSLISYTTLCIGRTIVGIGNESLSTALRVFAVHHFDKSKHGIVLSIMLATASAANALNLAFIYEIYSIVESIQFIIIIPLILYTLFAIPLFMNMYCSQKHIAQTVDESIKLIPKTDTTKTTFNISDLNKFSLMYWILICIICLIDTGFSMFVNIQVSFIHHTYKYTYSFSSMLASISAVMSLLLLPCFGYITDRFGIKCRLLLLGNILMGIAHYLFGWVHINIFITILTLLLWCISLSMRFATMWSSIPLLVETNIMGTAWGIASSFRFISNGFGYFIVGLLTKTENNNTKYINAQFLEISIAFITVILVLI
eukprot:421335_1